MITSFLRVFFGGILILISIIVLFSGSIFGGLITLVIGLIILPINILKRTDNIEINVNEAHTISQPKEIVENQELNKISELIKKFNSTEKSNELGVFYRINYLKRFVPEYQIKHLNDKFYFGKYLIRDGDWVNMGIGICKIITETDNNGQLIQAEKSGYLEHTFKSGDEIIDGHKISKIHQEGDYPKQNSPKNDNYHHYNYNSGYGLSTIEWKVSDGDYIRKGSSVYVLKEISTISYSRETTYHEAEKDGFIDINLKSNSYDVNELIYSIRNDDYIRVNKKYVNIPKIIIDEFLNKKEIKWEKVSTIQYTSEGVSSFSDDGNINLTFTLNYIKDADYIVFYLNPKELNPKENDSVSFLFENNEQIEFYIHEKPIVIKDINKHRMFVFKTLITKSELDLFENIDFKKWKIKLNSENREILGGEFGDKKSYSKKSNLIIVIKKFAREYKEKVKKEISNYSPLELKEEKYIANPTDNTCYVYLMSDLVNNYHKIGISNSPKYREKTLQSEKPSIELITSKKFPVRKIAESIEKALHETYSEKRIRGEWFHLTKDDIENIIETLK